MTKKKKVPCFTEYEAKKKLNPLAIIMMEIIILYPTRH
jgi:hypothetical protein